MTMIINVKALSTKPICCMYYENICKKSLKSKVKVTKMGFFNKKGKLKEKALNIFYII